MRYWIFLLALLTACTPRTPVLKDYSPNIRNVQFPQRVNAGQPLTITLEVLSGGGCNSFHRIDAERTAAQLNLKPIGKTPDYVANAKRGIEVACVTLPDHWQSVSYTDSGEEPRQSDFKVLVNGKAFGSVEIK